MSFDIHVMEIEKHGHMQFVHKYALLIESSNKKNVAPLAVLYRLTLAAPFPTLPVGTDIREVV